MTCLDTDTRSGDGWTVLDTTCYAGKPGVYDIGARLGVTTNTILLVILRAAERWAPDGALPENAAIVPRRGRVLVQFADGSSACMTPIHGPCRAGGHRGRSSTSAPSSPSYSSSPQSAG
jgi:hypothetical protein